MKTFYFCFSLALLFSCKKHNNQSTDYIITHNSVGNIKIGSSINNIKSNLNGYKFNVESTHCFGLDGGGNGILVCKQDTPHFFVWAMPGTTAIKEIIVLHSKYHFHNNLHVGSTVRDLLSINKNILFNLDLMNNWEYCDFSKHVKFVFNSDSITIGKYPKLDEEKSKAFNKTPKVFRIIIH